MEGVSASSQTGEERAAKIHQTFGTTVFFGKSVDVPKCSRFGILRARVTRMEAGWGAIQPVWGDAYVSGVWKIGGVGARG